MPRQIRQMKTLVAAFLGLSVLGGVPQGLQGQTTSRFLPVVPSDSFVQPIQSQVPGTMPAVWNQASDSLGDSLGDSPVSGPGEYPQRRATLLRGQDAMPPTQAGAYPPGNYSPGYAGDPYYNGSIPAPAYNAPPVGYGIPQGPLNSQVPGGSLGYFQSIPSVLGQGDFADLDVYVTEGQTGRFMFGGAYNSDAGLTGQIILDERNFDLFRWPRNLRDVMEGRAFRGGGQRFRMELVPGSQVQRYMVSLTEPYLFDTNISFRVSGYFFNRQYFDWDEERLGGELQLGYRLTPDLSLGVSVRAENINVSDPRLNTSAQLNNMLGDTDLFLGRVTLTHDTRDHAFMPTEGRYLEIGLGQGFGEFSYPRADLDFRKYFLLYQRPDRSGRHTLSMGTRVGVSGSDTPLVENYFAGGFSTMRGFDFRGASPVEGGVVVGGKFQWLNTVEYTFPLTADDMVKGVAFVDFGTVEDDVRLDADSFRVAPGLGLRIHMPAAGAGGAPLAFDFAVPLMRSETDDTKIFSFYLGFIR